MLALATMAACGDDDDGDDQADTDTSTGRSTVADEPTTTTPFATTLEAVGSGELDGVTVAAELVVDGATLQLTYRLENASDRTLLVGDAVAAPEGATHGPDPTGAWVTASSQGFVTVGKWPVAVPPEGGEGIEALSLYMTQVEPGASVDGRIELDWPLQGNHPYLAPDDLPVPLPDPVETLRLCVGVDPLTPEREQAPIVEEAGRSWLAVPMDQLRGTLCTEPASVVP
ncbi:MAG: hypothetical protein ACRD2C_18345 [Acidimicrobiales bacterium]